MLKYSRQRESILNNLRGRYDHPTAAMVYESVRMEQPNISLGTVYRNLSLLSDNGQILKISTGIGPDRFDGENKPHNHFVCRCCGNVTDLEFVLDEKIVEEASQSFDGHIEGYELRLFGTCGQCLSKKN